MIFRTLEIENVFRCLPQYATEHHERCGDIGRVQHSWSVRPHAGQESPHPPVLVLHCLAQPEFLQVWAGPLPEGKSFHQFRGVWRFAFVSSPFFYYHCWIYNVKDKHTVQSADVTKQVLTGNKYLLETIQIFSYWWIMGNAVFSL